MAKRIEGDLKDPNRPKPLFPDEWFDGTQWELTWAFRETAGTFDIPNSVESPQQRLRYYAKRLGKKLKIQIHSKSPWVFRIQAIPL